MIDTRSVFERFSGLSDWPEELIHLKGKSCSARRTTASTSSVTLAAK